MSRLTVGGAVFIIAVVASVKVCSTEGFARLTGARALVVTSGSMSPAFGAGDLVVVRSVDADDVRAGDIVTFATEGSPPVLVTHRVVRTIDDPVKGVLLMTKGDANQGIDSSPVTGDRIIGRYVLSIPRLGFMGVPAGLPLILLLLAIVLASAALTAGKGRRKPGLSSPAAGPTKQRETQGREK